MANENLNKNIVQIPTLLLKLSDLEYFLIPIKSHGTARLWGGFSEQLERKKNYQGKQQA